MKCVVVCLIAVTMSLGCATKKPPKTPTAMVGVPSRCLKKAIVLKGSDCPIVGRGEMVCNKVKILYNPECEVLMVKK